MHEYSIVQAMFDQIGAGLAARRERDLRARRVPASDRCCFATAYDLRTLCETRRTRRLSRWTTVLRTTAPLDDRVDAPAGDELIARTLELEVP